MPVDERRSQAERRPQRLLLAHLIVAVVSFAPRFVVAESLDERFVDGLRQRQLYALAEKFCRDALAASDLSDVRRAELTIELSRTLSEQALQAAPDKRDAIWSTALAAVEQFARQNPKAPRLVQIRAQQGLVELSWGELLRQEAELAGNRDERLDDARKHLRAAIDTLTAVSEKAAELQRRLSPARKSEAGELSSIELRSLEKNIQFQLARALRNQGESYPAESADRLNSLTQAAEILRPLSDADARDPLTWPSRLDAASCYRLLGHLEAAERRLDQIDSQSPPPRVQLRARAERIRLALADDRVQQAVTLADETRSASGQSSADLDFAALEAYLGAWRAAVDDGTGDKASAWQTKATGVLRDIQRLHGSYWYRRADALFAEQVAGSPATTDIDVLGRAAEGFYRSGQIDDALAAYDRALQQAHKAGQEAKAFELGSAAAAIEHERKNFQSAADRFRQVAIAAPRQPKASEAHLLAVYDAGQAARAAPQEGTKRYQELLEEHLKTWPSAASAARANLWLARIYERDQDWQRAIDKYRAASSGADVRAAAVEGLAKCYQGLLTDLRAQNKPTASIAAAAAAALKSAAGIENDNSQAWSSDQLAAVLSIATIVLNYADNGPAAAEELLTRALATAQDAETEWRAAAQALRVYAIAAEGRIDDAAKHVDELAGASPAALDTLVERLDRLCQDAQPAQRKNAAQFELRVLELIDKHGGGDDDERRERALSRTRALRSVGRFEEAAAELKSLAAANPRDGRFQEALAAALAEANDPGALAAWQSVERKSRSGSERWLRAKWNEALLYERQGDRVRAKQTVLAVKTLYPEMGGAELQRKFLDLLERNP